MTEHWKESEVSWDLPIAQMPDGTASAQQKQSSVVTSFSLFLFFLFFLFFRADASVVTSLRGIKKRARTELSALLDLLSSSEREIDFGLFRLLINLIPFSRLRVYACVSTEVVAFKVPSVCALGGAS